MRKLIDEILEFAEKYPQTIKVTREQLESCYILDIRDMREGEERLSGFIHVRKENDSYNLWADRNESPEERTGFICCNVDGYDPDMGLHVNDKEGEFFVFTANQIGTDSHV